MQAADADNPAQFIITTFHEQACLRCKLNLMELLICNAVNLGFDPHLP